MAYDDAILVTADEISLFYVGRVGNNDFGLTSVQFSNVISMLHEMAEKRILQYINRTDLEAEDLAANPAMAANLKFATIQMVSNAIKWFKRQFADEIVSVNDTQMVLKTPVSVMLDKEIESLIKPYRKVMIASVDPDEDYE
jgi:hypothetical protein